MNCGRCKGQGVTVEHVRACYTVAPKQTKSEYETVEVLQLCSLTVSDFCSRERHIDVRVSAEMAGTYERARKQLAVAYESDDPLTDMYQDQWTEARDAVLDTVYDWQCESCLEERAHDRTVVETTKGTVGDQLTERAHTQANRYQAVLNKLAATTDDETGEWTPKRPWDSWAGTSPKMAEAFESLVDMEMAHETGESDFEELTDTSWFIEDPRVTTAAMTALAIHDRDEFEVAEAAHWEAFTARVSRKRESWEYGLDLLCPRCLEIQRACEC